jgi:D-glycero-alpha-D-manno-heptose 1-phosphate guanylyltransferase
MSFEQPLIANKKDPIIVLAGGLGSRLQGAIGEIPKPLAPIGAKPFLHFLLDEIEAQGFTQVILSCHHLAEQIVSFVDAYQKGSKLSLRVVIEPAFSGTGGAIQHCINSLGLKGSFFVCNGDTMIPNGLQQLLAGISTDDAYIGVVPMSEADRYGIVDVGAHGYVNKLQEKNYADQGLINGGIYSFHTSTFKADIPSSLEREVLPGLIEKKKLKAVTIESSFIDIGIPSDYNKFCRLYGTSQKSVSC